MDPKYFHVLQRVIDDNQLRDVSKRIWNMDESGLRLDHTPGKVIARKGTRYLQSATSGNRETITVFATVNADGGSLPPHFIVKGKS